jgi:hypothetical protein
MQFMSPQGSRVHNIEISLCILHEKHIWTLKHVVLLNSIYRHLYFIIIAAHVGQKLFCRLMNDVLILCSYSVGVSIKVLPIDRENDLIVHVCDVPF